MLWGSEVFALWVLCLVVFPSVPHQTHLLVFGMLFIWNPCPPRVEFPRSQAELGSEMACGPFTVDLSTGVWDLGSSSGEFTPDTCPGSQGTGVVDTCCQSLSGFRALGLSPVLSAGALACFSSWARRSPSPVAAAAAPLHWLRLVCWALPWHQHWRDTGLSWDTAKWRSAQVEKPCDEGPWQMQQALVSPGTQSSSVPFVSLWKRVQVTSDLVGGVWNVAGWEAPKRDRVTCEQSTYGDGDGLQVVL